MFDPTKPVQTRAGREVRIYATDGGGCYPIHGAVKNSEGWEGACWRANGDYRMQYRGDYPGPYDLINVPEKRRLRGWVNVYCGNDTFGYATREEAERRRSAGCTACVEIDLEYEEGQGLGTDPSA